MELMIHGVENGRPPMKEEATGKMKETREGCDLQTADWLGWEKST